MPKNSVNEFNFENCWGNFSMITKVHLGCHLFELRISDSESPSESF